MSPLNCLAIDQPFERSLQFEIVRRTLLLESSHPPASRDQIIQLLDHLDQLTDKSILKNVWPSLLFQVIQLNLPNTKHPPNISVIKRLVYEFQFDINSRDMFRGTILHMLCRYHGYQVQVCEFLTQLKEDGHLVDLEVKAFIDDTKQPWQTSLLDRGSLFKPTPLEYAIETRCYKLARHLISLGACVDHLQFNELFLSSRVRYWDRRDHFELTKALLYLNIFTLDQVMQAKNLSEQRKALLQGFMGSRSLFELCMRVIRKYPQQSTGSKSSHLFVEDYQRRVYLPRLTSFFTLSEL